MQVNDITSYLYSTQAANLLSQAVDSATKSTQTDSSSTKESAFSSMLSEEIKNLTEFSELTSVLGGSVLGNISDTSSLQALSEDLLGTGSGREVISKLAEGHLNSIVFSDGDDDEDDETSSLTSSLSTAYTEAVTSTSSLENIIEEAMEVINTASKQ